MNASSSASGDTMKKAYFKFILISLLLTILLTFCTFYAVYIATGWISYRDFIQSAVYVSLITSSMVIVLGLFSFCVSIDDDAITVGFPGRRLEWNEIDRVKIVGIPNLKFLNRLIISGKGKELDIKLFVFQNQDEFIDALKSHLPWVAALDTKSIPSEARRS